MKRKACWLVAITVLQAFCGLQVDRLEALEPPAAVPETGDSPHDHWLPNLCLLPTAFGAHG